MYGLLTEGSTVEIRRARPQANFYLRLFSTSPRAAGQEAKRVRTGGHRRAR